MLYPNRGPPKSGYQDLPDRLLYGLQPRPAVGEEVEHAQQLRMEGWRLFGTYKASSPACPRASSSCLCFLPMAGSISPLGAPSHDPSLLPPAWHVQAKPGDKPQPPGQYPMGTDPLASPCPGSPFLHRKSANQPLTRWFLPRSPCSHPLCVAAA